MGDVVKEGRTVLFVSHNMDAVTALCTHVVVINQGRASERLDPEEGVKRYLALAGEGADLPLAQKPRQQHEPRKPIFTGLRIHTDSGHERVVEAGGGVTFEVEISDCADLPAVTCGVAIVNSRGQRVAFFHTRYQQATMFAGADRATLTCRVPSLPLVPSAYSVELVMADEDKIIEKVERADRIDVVFKDLFGSGRLPNSSHGPLVLPCHWDFDGVTTERRPFKDNADSTS
jgi:lipopolysaccharide transport system ATP-binding protein